MGNYLGSYLGRMYISREDSDWDIARNQTSTAEIPNNSRDKMSQPSGNTEPGGSASSTALAQCTDVQPETTTQENKPLVENPASGQLGWSGGSSVNTGKQCKRGYSDFQTLRNKCQKLCLLKVGDIPLENCSSLSSVDQSRSYGSSLDDDEDKSNDIDKFASVCHPRSDASQLDRCTLKFGTAEPICDEPRRYAETCGETLHINTIPSYLLVNIFRHVNIYDLLHNVCLVSKYWYDLARDPDLWRVVNLPGQLKVDDHILQRVISYSESVLSVDISDAKLVSDDGIATLAKQCTGLKNLKLVRCVHLKDPAFVSLGNHCPNIVLLHLNCCFSLSDKALATIAAGCPKLRVLHINQCGGLSNEGIQAMSRNCEDLEDLSLDQCKQIGDPGLLSVIECCPKLKRLSAMSCVFTSYGIIQLSKLHHLQRLELHDVLGVTDDCIMKVVCHCKELQTLNLSLCTRITDRAVDYIARNARCIKQLFLASCDLTNQALVSLGAHSRTLEKVDVGWCPNITDDGAVGISETCVTLRSLGLTRCDKVTIQTMDYLVEKYPHIRYSTFWLDCRRLMNQAYRMGYAPAGQLVADPTAIGSKPGQW